MACQRLANLPTSQQSCIARTTSSKVAKGDRHLRYVGIASPGLGATFRCASNRPVRVTIVTTAVLSVQVAPTTAKVTTPKVRPASSPYSPSGQPNTEAYAAPLRGRPTPAGASVDPSTGSLNFAVYSSSAVAVSLCLFREYDLAAGRVTYEIEFDPVLNKTGDMWHIMLPQMDETLLYGYRVSGPNQEKAGGAEGHRFKDDNIVLDPYAKAIIGRREFGELGAELDYESPDVLGLAATWPQCAAALPSVSSTFDWEGDKPLHLPMEELVIYEMHVRGFTQDHTSGVNAPGTYLGVVEKLDYLKELGVNAIELMPIHEFNELEYYQVIPGTDNYRFNFWGYSTAGFFSPMSRYSQAAKEGGNGEEIINEFKTLVKESHKRGIEVILDVVFNHTAEGNEQGPTISFRGLDNRVYYMLAPQGQYYNYSGCGNTFNCNHPVVRQFIVDCLRYWVVEMHVDGFRFDLGSIMTRAHSMWHQQQQGADGQPTAMHSAGAIVDHNGIMTDGAGVPTGTPMADPPLVQMISEDPILRNTKLIAEAWDADGLNQVGAFPHYGGRWAEWNGHFRDTVRQFIKGTDGNWTSLFASALCGSPDLYTNNTPVETDWWGFNTGRKWKGGRSPIHSVNFITAHDGFTLADLVKFNDKKNNANGEDNRDGENHNLSWNCGEEGDTEKMDINMLRQRQMRNFAGALLMAQGVPMVVMGDEYAHTKGGNNNTYCHDTRINWFQWDEMEGQSTGFARFFKHLINFRRSRPELQRATYPEGDTIQWHGPKPYEPNWHDPANRFLAFTLRDGEGGGVYCAFNTGHVPVTVTMPIWEGRMWQPVVDAGKTAPYDILMPDDVLSEEDIRTTQGSMSMWMQNSQYPMMPWSFVVLQSVPYTEPPLAVSPKGESKPPPRAFPPSGPAYPPRAFVPQNNPVQNSQRNSSSPSQRPSLLNRAASSLRNAMLPDNMEDKVSLLKAAAAGTMGAATRSMDNAPIKKQTRIFKKTAEAPAAVNTVEPQAAPQPSESPSFFDSHSYTPTPTPPPQTPPSYQDTYSSSYSHSSSYSQSQDTGSEDTYSQDTYSRDTYSNAYSKDTYSQDTYSRDTYSRDYSQDSNSIEEPEVATHTPEVTMNGRAGGQRELPVAEKSALEAAVEENLRLRKALEEKLKKKRKE